MTVAFNSFDDFISAAVTASVGAAVGTVVKMVKNPPRSVWHWFGEAFVRIAVGTMAGGIASEWLHLGPWVAASAAAGAAYIADEILKAMDHNADRLKNVEPPLPFEKDHDNGDR